MLAGVLLRFGLDAFTAARTAPALALAMFAAYLAGRRLWPRYAVVGVLAVGVAVAAAQGLLAPEGVRLALARPVFTAPTFTLGAVFGLAIPLFVVTTASQNVPGVAVMRGAGYRDTPVSPLVGWTGATTVLLAPFGGYAFNLAAITAAICMGREAHEDSRAATWPRCPPAASTSSPASSARRSARCSPRSRASSSSRSRGSRS